MILGYALHSWLKTSCLKILYNCVPVSNTMRPNKLKHQNLEQTKSYYRAKQGEQVICAPQTLNPLKGFIKAFLKARWRHGVPGSMINLSTILWLADGDQSLGFPTGSGGKESACNAGDLDSIPGSGRSPREGNGYPFQYSCLENFMNRGAQRATGVSKSRTQPINP